MSKVKKVISYIKNPSKIILFLGVKGKINFIPDKFFLKLMYEDRIGKKLNLANPKTYNEKLQWLKLYDRRAEYISMVDKFEVRKYISKVIGEDYLIPMIGIYNSFDEIDFEKLPNQFVLKCTHDSGGLIICKDKNNLDKEWARERITKSLKRNFYYHGREWPYKNIRPRIICEKYMVDESNIELKDYKFFCFNGIPKAMFIATDRGIDTRFDFYDMEFNHLPFMQHYKNSNKKIVKPKGFEQMLELAQKLAQDIPHVRVDFYDIDGKIYFGELTFYHFSGLEKFEPDTYDEKFGEWIELPLKNN